MKIAQACFRFNAPGGAEDHVLHISRQMVKRGHEVTVHASDVFTETPWKRGRWPQNETADGIRVVRHKAYLHTFSGRLNSLIFPGMVGGLLKEDADIFHAHSHRYFQLEAACYAGRARGIPYFITPHYHPAEEKETPWTKMMLCLYDLYSGGSIYRHARRVLTVTDLEKRYISSFVPEKKCVTVGNGIDPKEWRNVPGPDIFREKYSLGSPYLLYAGRLATNKGLEHLFRALPKILSEFDGKMVLVGKDWGVKATLVRMAREGGFAGKVRFIDFIADRETYKSALAGCELFVLPSQWEAFGIVLLEAAMCGKTAVATSVGGIPEVVEDGRTGLLVPYGISSSLARAVLSLLADPGLARAMGLRARENAKSRHTWPKVTDRILDAYNAMG